MSEQSLSLSPPRAGPLERLLRKQLFRAFEVLEESQLIIRDPEQDWSIGNDRSELQATVQVHDPAFYRHIALGGSVGAGESYILGHWDCDDLTQLMQIFVRNRDVLDGMETGLARLSAPILRLFHARNRNTREGSRRNIAAHYDLGNDLFELFLDESMMYSAAAYRTGKETLEEAQFEKLDRICRKLRLGPDTHVMEIGTGWGGFAIHAARHYGARVSTTTISQEQHALATARVQAEGLEDRVEILLEDYRDLTGTYDRVVSIEMIEAVGHHFLDNYMGKISSLLKPDGMALIQAITIEDHRYERALTDIDFIKRFIFPGSFIPSVNAIQSAATRTGDMRLHHLEDIGVSYALTLREWRRRFVNRLEDVKRLDYPESFIRMWIFYLCYCEGGFLERSIGDAQLVFAKPRSQHAEILPDLSTL